MKHKPVKMHEIYKDEARRLCPRCGDSFLAKHKDRFTCGKCGWTEFPKK